MLSDPLSEKPINPDNTPIMPRCGKCGAGKKDGAPIGITQMAIGPALCVVFFCGNPACGTIHNVQLMEMRIPQQQQPVIVTGN